MNKKQVVVILAGVGLTLFLFWQCFNFSITNTTEVEDTRLGVVLFLLIVTGCSVVYLLYRLEDKKPKDTTIKQEAPRKQFCEAGLTSLVLPAIILVVLVVWMVILSGPGPGLPGLPCFMFPVWIFGITMGMHALKEINNSNGLIRGRGCAIAGITFSVMGLAWVFLSILLEVTGVI